MFRPDVERVRATSSTNDELSDEEIAYQLQLEDIAESVKPHGQASSSSQAGRMFGRRKSCLNSGRLVPPNAVSDEEELFMPALGHNLEHNADRDRCFVCNDADSNVSREPELQMDCDICTEMRPLTSFTSTFGCDHLYCLKCCKQYAEAKISSGSSQISCPRHTCHHNFDIHQCRQLLSPPSFEILNTRQTEAAIPSSLKVYCPFKDCSAFMEKSESIPEHRSKRFVECGSCHRGFCLNCKIPWHADKSCAEYRADVRNSKESGDQKLLDLAKKKKWQICKECQRVIELKDGCYHMTCLCGNEFCYTCGAKWKNKVATCKCKLWEEVNFIRPRNFRPRT